MNLEKCLKFTRWWFFGDTCLNFILGFLLLLLPKNIDHVIGNEQVFPTAIYRSLGATFLAFAIWQAWTLNKGRITSAAALLFAACLAILPVYLLSIVLLYMETALKTSWKIILWAADIYMLLLGCWYLFILRWQRTSRTHSETQSQ